MNTPTLYTRKSLIRDIQKDPCFKGFGSLLFPLNRSYYHGNTLEELSMTWYSHIDPDMSVEIINTLKQRVLHSQKVFYDIYSEEEKRQDPSKRNTGLFFFKGKPNTPFAICNAGGAFAYVGAMHDSFPHALCISKHSYNAFALIYRCHPQLACLDLIRAIEFIHEHAKELEVKTNDYSLWGGSAGARMAAWAGSYAKEYFHTSTIEKPAAIIMQYTSYQDFTPNDPACFACVGDNDWIAPWQEMKYRLDQMKRYGIDTQFHHYPGLPHGFGLGTNTVAQGWIKQALSFWQEYMKTK